MIQAQALKENLKSCTPPSERNQLLFQGYNVLRVKRREQLLFKNPTPCKTVEQECTRDKLPFNNARTQVESKKGSNCPSTDTLMCFWAETAWAKRSRRSPCTPNARKEHWKKILLACLSQVLHLSECIAHAKVAVWPSWKIADADLCWSILFFVTIGRPLPQSKSISNVVLAAMIVSAFFDKREQCDIFRNMFISMTLREVVFRIRGDNQVVLCCFNSVTSNCGLWYADCRALCPEPSSQEDRTLAARSKKKKRGSFSISELRLGQQLANNFVFRNSGLQSGPQTARVDLCGCRCQRERIFEIVCLQPCAVNYQCVRRWRRNIRSWLGQHHGFFFIFWLKWL